MKIKDSFVLRKVADTYVVLPLLDPTINFDGMLSINETGVLLWEKLKTGATRDQLVKTLTDEFDVTEQTAETDVDAFIDTLSKAGCLEL